MAEKKLGVTVKLIEDWIARNPSVPYTVELMPVIYKRDVFLYENILRAIASGEYEDSPQELAKAALKIRDL